MRTTNEIIIAVKESQPVTTEELRLALLAQHGISYFYEHSLQKLIEAILEKKPQVMLEFKAKFEQGTMERMFQAIKTDPEKWLGPANIPGSQEYADRLKWCKNIYERDTGEKLE